jgi:hypothetical protein
MTANVDFLRRLLMLEYLGQDEGKNVDQIVKLWLAMHGGDPGPSAVRDASLWLAMMQVSDQIEDAKMAQQLRQLAKSSLAQIVERL